jgi:cytochrome d ubiquinol oxidase subunit I
MVFFTPMPIIASELGWMVTEVGRQPWIVYGIMRTKDAVSTLHLSQVATSLTAFIVLYSLLGIAAISLMLRTALQGPSASLPGDTQAKGA